MGIYRVTRTNAPAEEKPRLIEARTVVQAISHAARTTYSAEVLTPKQAHELGIQGIELESAKDEEG